MGRGILLRLDGGNNWDIDAVYSLTFIKPVSPDNMLLTYSGEAKEPMGLVIQLLNQLNFVYEDFYG